MDKTCNGANDCSDNSDELLPQCNSIPAKIDSQNGDSSTSVGVSITIGLMVFFCMGLIGAFVYFLKRRNNSSADNESNNPLSPSLDNAPNGTLQRVANVSTENKMPRTAPNGMVMVNNNSTIDDDAEIGSGGGVMSTVSGPSGAIGGSSNGIAYDRSHVTGASSSTSSSNFPRDFSNPPPSPATVIANRVTQHQQPPRQHQSMHSLPRSRQQHRGGRMAANRQYNGRSSHHIHHPPPPPTPYSTDFNEESDYGVGPSPSGPNYPSAANSTHGGYESSDAYAEHLGYNNPPPSTPHYYSDYVNENSCAPSPTPEENTFFLPQPPPPPSPVPSLSHLDDDDDDEENVCH